MPTCVACKMAENGKWCACGPANLSRSIKKNPYVRFWPSCLIDVFFLPFYLLLTCSIANCSLAYIETSNIASAFFIKNISNILQAEHIEHVIILFQCVVH
jgi:hypothetical protein